MSPGWDESSGFLGWAIRTGDGRTGGGPERGRRARERAEQNHYFRQVEAGLLWGQGLSERSSRQGGGRHFLMEEAAKRGKRPPPALSQEPRKGEGTLPLAVTPPCQRSRLQREIRLRDCIRLLGLSQQRTSLSGLNHANPFSHNSGGETSKVKASSGASVLDLGMASSSLCPHTAFLLCGSLSSSPLTRTPVVWDRARPGGPISPQLSL